MLSTPPRSPAKRASALGSQRHRRLVWRLAAGSSAREAAEQEGCAVELVERLLEEPATRQLIEDWAARDTLDDATRRAELLDLAWIVMRRALLAGDLRVALFIAKEEARGRDPCATLARSLEAQRRRVVDATAPPAAASGISPARPCPAGATGATGGPVMPDPLHAATAAAARQLRTEIAAERDAQTVAGVQAASSDPAADPSRAAEHTTAPAGPAPVLEAAQATAEAPAPAAPAAAVTTPGRSARHALRAHLLAGIAAVGCPDLGHTLAPLLPPAIRAGPSR